MGVEEVVIWWIKIILVEIYKNKLNNRKWLMGFDIRKYIFWLNKIDFLLVLVYVFLVIVVMFFVGVSFISYFVKKKFLI